MLILSIVMLTMNGQASGATIQPKRSLALQMNMSWGRWEDFLPASYLKGCQIFFSLLNC